MTQKTVAALVSGVVLAMGAVMMKLQILDNLAAARVHGDVRIEEKPLFLGPLLVLFGALGLLVLPFAKDQPRRPGPPPKPTVLQYVIGISIAAVAGAVSFAIRAWLLDRLAKYGYKI